MSSKHLRKFSRLLKASSGHLAKSCGDKCFRTLYDCDGNLFPEYAIPCSMYDEEIDVHWTNGDAKFCGKIGERWTDPVVGPVIPDGLTPDDCETCSKKCRHCDNTYTDGENPGCPESGMCCPDCYLLSVFANVGCCGCRGWVDVLGETRAFTLDGYASVTINQCTGVRTDFYPTLKRWDKTGSIDCSGPPTFNGFSPDSALFPTLIAGCTKDARNNARSNFYAKLAVGILGSESVEAIETITLASTACYVKALPDSRLAVGCGDAGTHDQCHCGGGGAVFTPCNFI